MFFKSAILVASLIGAAVMPLPDVLCPAACKCVASLTIDGNAVPVSLGNPGSSWAIPYSGESSWGYGTPNANVVVTGQGAGWGPNNGQCKKADTNCSECGLAKCRFQLNLKVDITDFDLAPTGGTTAYKWKLTLPSEVSQEINNSTGNGTAALIDKSPECNIGPTKYRLQVLRHDVSPASPV